MARKLMTDTRSLWVRNREFSGVMRGAPLPIPAGVVDRYSKQLERITDRMTATTKSELVALFKRKDMQEYFAADSASAAFSFVAAMDASPASQLRMLTNRLRDEFQGLFASVAKPLADAMAKQANKASETATKLSLTKLSGGLKLSTDFLTRDMDEFLKASVSTNVSLIKTIPEEFFADVQQQVLSSITSGKGLHDLTDYLENERGVQHRRAKNIAIDQTHKVYQGLNAERMKKVGVEFYEWIHSHAGIKPRPLHQSYHGRIFSFANPPVIDMASGERGIPGQAINCKCTMVPVMKFEDGEKAA